MILRKLDLTGGDVGGIHARMYAQYIITLPPSRRRRRRWFTGQRETLGQGRRFLAAAAILALGLPVAWGVVSALSGAEPEDTEIVTTAEMSLPELPAVDAEVSQETITALMPPLPAAEKPFAMANAAVIAPSPPPAPGERKRVTLKKGDTLMGLLLSVAVPEAEAHEAMNALHAVYNPRGIRAGQKVDVIYSNGAFQGFEFAPTSEKTMRVERKGEEYKAATLATPLSRQVMAASATIRGSLFEAGAEAGVPHAALVSLIKVLSYSVDFQRDIHEGDSFKVLYETMRAPDGSMVKTGNVLYAEVNLGGRMFPMYRHEFADGRVEYFDRQGKSLRKALLRTPVDGARVSSGFGMRTHPVLGYSKMHQGVDFAAPTGTPIYAGGDGVVVERGKKGGYGNFILIRHGGGYSTAYGHMSRFKSDVQRGTRVRQGEVIGYVGSTGRSTGPHLHYEVRIDGRQVNPANVKNMPSGDPLKGRTLETFKGLVEAIDRNFEQVTDGKVMAVAFGKDAAPATNVKAN